MVFMPMPAGAAGMGRAGVFEATKNPATPPKSGFMGLDPITWMMISGALGQGAQGGGWGAAAQGIAGALQQRKDQTEADSRSDAQQRAVARMQAGDMKGAMAILASAKGLEDQAMDMSLQMEGRDYARSEDDRRYDRGVRRDDFEYGRGRRDAAFDTMRDRNFALTDEKRSRGYQVEDREDSQAHDRSMGEADFDRRKKLFELENAGGGIDPGEEKGLTGEYLGQAKTFIDVRDAFARIQQIEKYVQNSPTPSPASDISLVFNFMKMNDPGSTVREGEYATAQNATSVPGQIRNAYNKALNGTGLSPEMRADFLASAKQLYAAQESTYQGTLDQYRARAERYRMDPGIIQDLRMPQPEEPPQEQERPASAVAIPPALQGKLSPIEAEAWDELTDDQRKRVWQKYMGTPMQQRGLHVPGQRGSL